VKRARLLAVVLLLVAAAHATKIPPGERKIYSNVRYNKQTRELVGKELILVIFGEHVSATLNDFQGGMYPIQRVLKGTLRANQLRLHGRNEAGRLYLLATISGTHLGGSLGFRPVGERPKTESVQLRLAKGCVYPTCAGPTMD
jgi:hypothetical protein